MIFNVLYKTGLGDFSDTEYYETDFPTPNFGINFPKQHFPTKKFPKDIFSDNQNYKQLIIEPNLT